ncbi:ankyrin repeat-containing domain protein [Tuber borchii]|uniref:Ankyrin repeat-containing domain protein n=1 Tax=Tuber borchii TaxID=42251 RepID=A0A2T7A6R2_TUBBO|nr:ankyrin repeat-containing domain protein [Tuber borchii]
MALAAKGGYELSIIELLNGKANVEGADVSPLQCAAGAGHLIALKVLLDVGKCMVDAKDSLGRTALSLAAEEGHSETIQELLDRGADKETTSKRWLFTPLHFAAWNGKTEAVTTLIGANVKLSPRDDEGFTPLALACYVNRLDSVKLLLKAGADAEVPVTNRGWRRALHFAVGEGSVKIVKELLESGADVNRKRSDIDSDGASPLHIAARTGDLAVVEMLLKAGADFTSLDKDGKTPLQISMESGASTEEVSNLLADSFLNSKGFDLSRLADQGKSLFAAAISGHKPGALKRLLAKGIRPNLVDADGCSLLFHAVALGPPAAGVVRLLLSSGCDPSLPDKYGRIPLDVAHWPAIRSILADPKIADPEDVCPLFNDKDENYWTWFNCDVCRVRRNEKIFFRMDHPVFWNCFHFRNG